jgi:hypothetical protein
MAATDPDDPPAQIVLQRALDFIWDGVHAMTK